MNIPRELTVTLERAEGLKDHDLFTKQDPYAIITCGARKQRSRVHKSGGSNPVWNQSFTFSVVNEQEIDIRLMDEDTLTDDFIGSARVSLAKVKSTGSDTQRVPVHIAKGRGGGFVHVRLSMPRAPGAAGPMPGQYGAPPPGAYGAPPPGQYGAPPPGQYGAPSPYGAYGAPPPGQYGAPPPGQYGAPPPGQYGAPPPGQYGAPPPAQYGAPPPGQYGAPPPTQYGAPPPGAYGMPPNGAAPPGYPAQGPHSTQSQPSQTSPYPSPYSSAAPPGSQGPAPSQGASYPAVGATPSPYGAPPPGNGSAAGGEMGLPWLMGPTPGAPPPASSAPSYASYQPSAPGGQYASQVQQLRAMGFDEASSTSALQRTNGNVQAAVDLLAGR